MPLKWMTTLRRRWRAMLTDWGIALGLGIVPDEVGSSGPKLAPKCPESRANHNFSSPLLRTTNMTKPPGC